MGELLGQSLQLTVVGMGMTFAAIGALVLGMYLMTAWIKDKPREVVGPVEETEAVGPIAPQSAVEDGRYRAAAAAVAVALAQTRTRAAASAPAAPSTATEGWDTYARGRHVSRRDRYEALRARTR